jgi:hypothetical protein
MRMNRYPPFPPAVVPLLKTAEQRWVLAKNNQRLFLRQMRSEYCEEEKTERKDRGLVKLLVASRRWGVYLARTIQLNRDEAGKVTYMRFLAMEANCKNYFCGSAIVRTGTESIAS